MSEPFALYVHRRFLNGESSEALSRELGISLPRIQQRLRAAEQYLKSRGPAEEPADDGRISAAGLKSQ